MYIITNFLVALLISGNFSHTTFQRDVYSSYINADIPQWETAIATAERALTNSDFEMRYTYAMACYGIVGNYLGQGDEDKAEYYLTKALRITNDLLDENSKSSKALALRGALYGFQISLNSYKAVYLGPKSLSTINQALAIDKTNPTAWIEYGNAMYYMPEMFGGDKQEAINAYKKAIALFENESRIDCWIYLNSVVILGTWLEKQDQFIAAKQQYDKALSIAPNLKWVSMELLPDLIFKMRRV